MSETKSTADRTVKRLRDEIQQRQFDQHIEAGDALMLFGIEHGIAEEDLRSVEKGLTATMLIKVLSRMVETEPGDLRAAELARRQMMNDLSAGLRSAYIVGVLVGRGWVDQP